MKKKWRVMFFTETINGKKEQSTKWFFEYHEAEQKMHELQIYSPNIIEKEYRYFPPMHEIMFDKFGDFKRMDEILDAKNDLEDK